MITADLIRAREVAEELAINQREVIAKWAEMRDALTPLIRELAAMATGHLTLTLQDGSHVVFRDWGSGHHSLEFFSAEWLNRNNIKRVGQ